MSHSSSSLLANNLLTSIYFLMSIKASHHTTTYGKNENTSQHLFSMQNKETVTNFLEGTIISLTDLFPDLLLCYNII